MSSIIYNQQVKKYQDSFKKLSVEERKLSVYRLLFFIVSIGIIIASFSYHPVLGIVLILVFLISFSRLLKYHDSVLSERDIAKLLVELNKNEIKALDNDHSWFDSGEEYEDALHHYSTDLDIFGEHSIFQLISRCSTVFGKDELADKLKNGLNFENILNHQEAVQELEPQLDARQRLYALGRQGVPAKHQVHNLINWINNGSELGITGVLSYASILLCWMMFFVLMYYFSWTMAILAFIPNALLLYRHSKKITQAYNSLEENEKLLKSYAQIIEEIEGLHFHHPILQEIHQQFSNGNLSASKELKQFAFDLRQLDFRTNFFGLIVNALFLWEHIYMIKIDKWKSKNGSYINQWFESIGKLESLSSLANFGYAHPQYSYPAISKDQSLGAKDLGHPLLNSKERVTNDFTMNTSKHIKIVTGSNMGGKSTFLRSVGVSMILANTGSKVCASSMKLPRLQVISSMRTQDALSENTSSFYAELKKLKVVIDQVKNRDDVFFLLDEILKGTNSKDRHRGAKAMIIQLLKSNGSGLISTHDLELGKMEKEHPDLINNICFEVEVMDQELRFDYKIKQGISKSFNATHLMRNIGIDI